MSEKLPTYAEKIEEFEHQLDLPEGQHEKQAAPAETAQVEKSAAETVAEARAKVAETLEADKASSPAEQLKTVENASRPTPASYISRELRDITALRELRRLQRLETPLTRQFSKVIHQPAVRAMSEAAGATVSRPSGLLGGGLVALLGTSTYLYLARHIGFPYNYGVFLVLFVGGFFVGLALELVVHLFTSRDTAD